MGGMIVGTRKELVEKGAKLEVEEKKIMVG